MTDLRRIAVTFDRLAQANEYAADNADADEDPSHMLGAADAYRDAAGHLRYLADEAEEEDIERRPNAQVIDADDVKAAIDEHHPASIGYDADDDETRPNVHFAEDLDVDYDADVSVLDDTAELRIAHMTVIPDAPAVDARAQQARDDDA